MAPEDNPILFGTQKQYAWNIWQLVYGSRLPDRQEFEAWWTSSTLIQWESERMLFSNAWNTASESLSKFVKLEFNAWFQQLIDEQGKTS